MATTPKGTEQAQPDAEPHVEPPSLDEAPHHHSVPWPEGADMVSQQGAANRMFRQNSERLQQENENKRETQSQEQSPSDELVFAKDRGRGNYNELKRDQANATGLEATQAEERRQDRDTDEDELTFVKDSSRESRTDENPGQAVEAEDELVFVKDQGQSRSQGR